MALIIRKLQKHSGTLMVSIPLVWRKEKKLEKGSPVEILQNRKGDLIIRPTKNEEAQA